MKLQVLADERFSCQSCTNCCRSWFVELMPGEEEGILNLSWGEGDPLSRAKKILRHGGKAYLERRADGACLFLNESNGLCRIHERFGFEKKPLGCRVFPYQIAPTFRGEASVIGRYDCPTVRKNEGKLYSEELRTLQGFAGRLGMSEGFDEITSCHLEKEQIQGVSDFVGTMMMGFATGEGRALFMAYLCDVLASTDASDLDREALAAVFGGLKRVVENGVEGEARRPGWFGRAAFRTLLGLYLRRDEDVLTGKVGRVGRAWALAKLVLGFGTFRGLGLSHPAGAVRRARLFEKRRGKWGSGGVGNAEVYGLFWRMVRNRLEGFQFMGPANNGRDFLEGLRSLALLYPLVVAAAKFRAGNRGANEVGVEDVDYAVMAIEHSFGRLPVLGGGVTRSIEKLLMGEGMFGRVVKNV